MKRTTRIALVFFSAWAVLATLSSCAQAQAIDAAFGFGTLTAPGASSSSGNHSAASLTGGGYLGFGADLLFWHNLGIGSEFYWRAHQNDYPLNPLYTYRPIFFDFNAVYSPKLAEHVYAEVDGGIGVQDTRFYCPTCTYAVINTYSSDKHFMGDFGGGLKLYPMRSFFIRPEARFYLVNNNLYFSSARSTRLGVSVGYTFGHH